MDSSNEKDPRNALASWDGYEFQGQIALTHGGYNSPPLCGVNKLMNCKLRRELV